MNRLGALAAALVIAAFAFSLVTDGLPEGCRYQSPIEAEEIRLAAERLGHKKKERQARELREERERERAIQPVTAGNAEPFCATKSLYRQFRKALDDKDDRLTRYLINNGCLFPDPNLPVSILDRGWTNWLKVRVYVGDDSGVFWTSREAIVERRR